MPNNPAASPTVSSTVGLKNMVIAELVTDTEDTLTYGDLQLVAGAIEASVEPQNACELFSNRQESIVKSVEFQHGTSFDMSLSTSEQRPSSPRRTSYLEHFVIVIRSVGTPSVRYSGFSRRLSVVTEIPAAFLKAQSFTTMAEDSWLQVQKYVWFFPPSNSRPSTLQRYAMSK